VEFEADVAVLSFDRGGFHGKLMVESLGLRASWIVARGALSRKRAGSGQNDAWRVAGWRVTIAG
jgi:hypothetical protein